MILDIPKLEVESKMTNQCSKSLRSSKAAHDSMWLIQVLISLPNFWHVLIDSLFLFVCKHCEPTALMYKLQG